MAPPPPTAAAAKTLPKKKKKAVKEKRPARYRSSCPAKLAERLLRAATQRLYLISKTSTTANMGCELTVLGSTGNVYTVQLQQVPTCTCPDFAKKQDLCKHILFVLLKVVGLDPSNPLSYQKAFLLSELEEILELLNARRVGGVVLANDRVRAVHAQMVAGQEPDDNNDGVVERRSLEQDCDCPICFDAMVPGPLTTYCRATCGTNFHVDCIRRWCSNNSQPTCPNCRQPWQWSNSSPSQKKEGNTEGYVNLGQLQGQSRVRDTSTYRQWSPYYYKRRRYDYD